MPQYVIERDMPGVGSLGQEDLKGASQTSCSVLRELGPEIQWVHSYVTDDKIYCIYRAPNEDIIREHARNDRSDDGGVGPQYRRMSPASRPWMRTRFSA